MVTGYIHPEYAESLAEFGTPRELPRSGGWILRRQIPMFPYQDGMGCYPLLSCQDWSQLRLDLDEIGTELVSLSAVLDPFGDYDAAYLHLCFKDVINPFKQHFIVDLSRPIDTIPSRHHNRYVRKALDQVSVETCQEPAKFVNEWTELYSALIQKHNIKGITAFSKRSFVKQLHVPGIVVFRAMHKEATVGMTLWYIQGEVGYYHLGASSILGYDLNVSFGLFWHALNYFADKVRWLDLGAGAGIKSDGTDDGLSRFKRGWSTGTRTAYFCGRIFDHAKYAEVVRAKGICATEYFPAYRSGEFG